MESLANIRAKISVTPAEAGKLLSTSRDEVMRLVHSEAIPYYKRGNKFLIPTKSLEDYALKMAMDYRR